MTVTAEELASGILVAYAMFEQGKYAQAEILAEGFLTLDPDNAYLHNLLASAFFKQNKLEQAVKAYTRAIELHSGDIASFVNRGEIYLKFGKFWEAAQDLKQASDLDPERKSTFANRARLLMQMTSGALKIADEGGIEALHEAQRRIEADLRRATTS